MTLDAEDIMLTICVMLFDYYYIVHINKMYVQYNMCIIIYNTNILCINHLVDCVTPLYQYPKMFVNDLENDIKILICHLI